MKKRVYAPILSLNMGTILMILGFFIYLSSGSKAVAGGIIIAGGGAVQSTRRDLSRVSLGMGAFMPGTNVIS